MKILHILAYAHRGGCEKNCFYFIESKKEATHDVLVLDQHGPMITEWELLGVQVKVLNILCLNLLSFYNSLKKSLPAVEYETIIVWTNIRMPIILNVLNKYETNIFVHVGNPVINRISERLKNQFLSVFFPIGNCVYLRPVSGYVKESILKHPYYRRFRNQVSLKPIKTTHVRVNKPTRIDRNSVLQLGMVARLDGIKDHETVIRAFSIIRMEYPFAILNLVGGGVLRDELEALALSLNLKGAVVFHGDVGNVYEVIREWHLFVYATTLAEGLGGTIPEALSIGLPIVSVDLPMIREWDKEGRFIVFCNASDHSHMASCVISELDDEFHRNFVYEQGPIYVAEHFSPTIFSSNYISIN
ncbi:glycosyltransferase [Chryseosolibacter indicus]|uniref:Glycosyltransferase n=1 Tax=Chryseosolibacter indicus TaxID=2782351 RepID=A0ABS5VY19_9BACT|nr:glycosyltransferase [Chryseosolibacter indicus]MBT1704896.1 glycosyltransferase [Chryseosolibacter indicus]